MLLRMQFWKSRGCSIGECVTVACRLHLMYLGMEVGMTVERAIRGIAGSFVVLSVALGYWVHPAFYLFTAFVGLNLFQSSFSNWCPMITILKKAGLN